MALDRLSRRWLFRLLAVAVGLSPFIAAEIGFRLAGVGLSAETPDPFVGFASVRPLFERNPAGDRYVIPPSRQPFFKPDSFPATKGDREFRIFCLGGSTVQGNPYSIETSFPTWLRLNLRAADPDRDWQVVNCGGISYASYRLAPILRECLAYQPDLFIIYLGQNEFLEDRSYHHLMELPHWISRCSSLLGNLRIANVATQCGQRALRSSTSPTRLTTEVDALLDYRGGLEQYRRDDLWQQGVVDHFRFTLARMIQDAQSAHVGVLLIDPVCNLKDCAPFKVEVDARLSQVERDRLRELLDADGSPDESIERLTAALRIDPRHAGAWFLLGKAYLNVGADQEAMEAFVQAKDEDICPLREIEPFRKAIAEIGESTQTPIVPVRKLFEQHSPHGIPGDEWLLDHVHPSITGHQMIADLLLETMVERSYVQRREGWQERRQELFARHRDTLDTPYFARGQEHLDGLRKWAQGRVTKLRPAGSP